MKQQRISRPSGEAHDITGKWMISAVAVGIYLAISHSAAAVESPSTTIVEGKGRPTIPTTLSVPTFVVGSPVTATASGSTDPDDDTINYQFRWCTVAGITAAEPLDGRCVEGATQNFSDSANRYVAARALAPTGYPQATQGASLWSAESVTGVTGSSPVASSVTITGIPKIGLSLSAIYAYSDADSDAEGVTRFQWYRDGSAIASATTSSYLLVASDDNKTITVGVTPVATNGMPTEGSEVVSAGVVAGSGDAPVASNAIITGSAKIGYSLTGVYNYSDANGDLEGGSRFQWYRDGAAIAGATAKLYRLTESDDGKNIVFGVTPVATSGAEPRSGAEVISSAVLVSGDYVDVPGVGIFVNTLESMSVANATNYCDNLAIGGFSDWRLPSKDELALLYNQYPDGQINALGWSANSRFWSSTPQDVTHNYGVHMMHGTVFVDESWGQYDLLCIR